MSAPTTYRVQAHSAPGGEARIDAGTETITFDASWAAAVPSGLPGPADLLASAFAACLLKNVERSGRLLPFRYQNAEVEVRAERQDSPPRFTAISYELRLVTDEPQHRVDLLHRNLRTFGTVYNTLAAVCDVQGHIVTESAPRASKAQSRPLREET
ncbi:OsmC family protein [Streptomyces albogriseolus]|uniref:OsmC family protein n=1 Tax=Streptomyces albogriseolus TaxID=1887 RepID=UPI003460AE9B